MRHCTLRAKSNERSSMDGIEIRMLGGSLNKGYDTTCWLVNNATVAFCVSEMALAGQ